MMAALSLSTFEKWATTPLLETLARCATAPNVTLQRPRTHANFNPSSRIQSRVDGRITCIPSVQICPLDTSLAKAPRIATNCRNCRFEPQIGACGTAHEQNQQIRLNGSRMTVRAG